jgi:hypothetical protein
LILNPRQTTTKRGRRLLAFLVILSRAKNLVLSLGACPALLEAIRGAERTMPRSLRRTAELAKTNCKLTKRIVRTLTTESAPDYRPEYEKEHLNFGQNSFSYKTNPPQLRRVGPPPLPTRKNKRQPGGTNHPYVEAKRAGADRVTYKTDSSHSAKTNPSHRTNHRTFLAAVSGVHSAFQSEVPVSARGISRCNSDWLQ